MINLLNDIQKPYWYTEKDLPGLDFNREIIKPGTNKTFPDGALGIRADGDFWAVAVLPLKYADEDFKEILNTLWPDYKDNIVITPDSGSEEQKLYIINSYAECERERADELQKIVNKFSEENERLRTKRPDLVIKPRSKQRATNDYFIQQYEHLLTAMAHEAIPRKEPELKGVCSICDLYCYDRVHSKRYINAKARGFDRSFKIRCELPNDEDFE